MKRVAFWLVLPALGFAGGAAVLSWIGTALLFGSFALAGWKIRKSPRRILTAALVLPSLIAVAGAGLCLREAGCGQGEGAAKEVCLFQPCNAPADPYVLTIMSHYDYGHAACGEKLPLDYPGRLILSLRCRTSVPLSREACASWGG